MKCRAVFHVHYDATDDVLAGAIAGIVLDRLKQDTLVTDACLTEVFEEVPEEVLQ